jgi:penicillin amidase
MRFIRRFFAILGILILVVVVILAGAGTWLVRRPWPQIGGTIKVPGLAGQVQVIRDKWGVPHIYAETEHDLAFAQGYVHAQDRLWQMEFNRRIGSGTLSAILGDSTLDIDRFMRTLGLRRAAEEDLKLLNGDMHAILEAYAAGVNAYIESHRGRLPLEFTILGVDPAAWTPLDSLTWGKVMAFNLGSNYDYELLRAKIIAELGQSAAQQLLPPYASGAPVVVPPGVGNYTWLRDTDTNPLPGLATFLGHSATDAGSNNWVVSGSRTESGQPLLADDTHLGLSMPSVWYENSLHGGRLDVAGYSFPGVPLVIMGHNSRIAWGVTNLPADVQDLYIEKLDNRANPSKYEFMGKWENLTVIPETIEVKGGQPVTVNVLVTRHGPIVNDVIGSLKDAEPLALRWTALGGTRLMNAVWGLDLASNWDEFRRALESWDVPSQNFVYADIEGHIGYQSPGLIPIRTPGHQGLVPVPGWNGEYEWQGFIPFDELPRAFDPARGFIVSANNKVAPDDYPYSLAYEWSAPYRAQRITDLLSANSKVTVDDIKSLHAQTYCLPAEALRPYLQAVQPASDLETAALELVKAWDLLNEADSKGAAVYQVWYWFLVRETLGDELSADLLSSYLTYDTSHVPMMVGLMSQADNTWFDDTSTTQRETRDDIVRRSFSAAVSWLAKNLGSKPDQWKWGRLHTKTFVHQPLGQSGIGIIERLFNTKAIPARGDNFTVDAAWFDYAQPFSMSGGVSQRLIVDLGDWGNSLSVHSTGQSGQLFHPHRADMVRPWQNVEYHPLLFSRADAEARAEGTLTLSPP